MKIYALLDEDRGGDTGVYLYNKYEDAKKHFDEIVSDIKRFIEEEGGIDGDNFNLDKDHLSYDMDDHWGNIIIYTKEFKE
tara:strand:- start:2596 stop:2835 length:240 start_codon:yes stop_codon:yes gene_type:complete